MKKINCFILVSLLFMVFIVLSFGVQANTIPEENLLLWLDAGSLELENGEAVEIWNDISGNQKHLKADNLNQAPVLKSEKVNGQPVVRFDSDSLKYNFAGRYAQPNMIFIVFNAFEQTGSILDNIEGGLSGHRYRFLLGEPHSGGLNMWSGSWWPENTHFLPLRFPTDFILITALFNDDSRNIRNWSILRKNGGEIIEYGKAGMASDRLVSLNLGAGSFKGDIAEMIIYTDKLSDQEIEKVENYLMQKYGL